MPEVTLATQTASHATAVGPGAPMRTPALDPAAARYLVYSNNVPLFTAKVIFLSFSVMFVHTKQLELL